MAERETLCLMTRYLLIIFSTKMSSGNSLTCQLYVKTINTINHLAKIYEKIIDSNLQEDILK